MELAYGSRAQTTPVTSNLHFLPRQDNLGYVDSVISDDSLMSIHNVLQRTILASGFSHRLHNNCREYFEHQTSLLINDARLTHMRGMALNSDTVDHGFRRELPAYRKGRLALAEKVLGREVSEDLVDAMKGRFTIANFTHRSRSENETIDGMHVFNFRVSEDSKPGMFVILDQFKQGLFRLNYYCRPAVMVPVTNGMDTAIEPKVQFLDSGVPCIEVLPVKTPL